MNRWKMVLAVIALAVPLTGIAKGGATFNGGYGRSSSYSRGFSSHGNAARPATPGNRGSFGTISSGRPAPAPAPAPGASAAKPSFGTFGSSRNAGAPVAPAEPRSKSAVTQGLEKNTAQSNAMKTFDERTGRQAQANSAPQAPYGAPGPAMPNTTQPGPAGPNYSPPPTYPQPQPPVVYQNPGSSGGFLSGVLGYMLGRSMQNNDQRNTIPMDNGSFNRQATPGNNTANAPAQQESTGSSFWRIFLWLILLSAIGWIIWYFVRRKKSDTPKKSNYSL